MIFFIQKTRSYPESFEKLGFKKVEDNLYLRTQDNSLWQQKKLLDLGYGKETGLARQPALTFEELIPLVFIEYNGKITDYKIG